MSRPSECCIHERVVWLKCELLEALGKEDRDMPVFACHRSSIPNLGLLVEVESKSLQLKLFPTLSVPDLDVLAITDDGDVRRQTSALALLGR